MARFQSTLPVAGERCFQKVDWSGRPTSFNPRSPLPGSDAGQPFDLRLPNMFQSTLPVAGERCGGHALAIGYSPREFQSTLPVAGERCNQPHLGESGVGAVSIHAPRCRGAMPERHLSGLLSIVFQSTLPVAGERCRLWPPVPSAGMTFQSTLPVAGERCRRSLRERQDHGGFNPRSPLPGSDAVIEADGRLAVLVSIHAPRCRGAMLDSAHCDLQRYGVSIHAPRCRGAMHKRLIAINSNRAVSIHAPRCRGAMPADGFIDAIGKQFQSTLPVAGERCDLQTVYELNGSLFQSTLPVAGERCGHAPPAAASAARFQSTLPVAGERCRPRRVPDRPGRHPFQSTLHVAGERCPDPLLATCTPFTRFNPRSPLPGSDAWSLPSACGSWFVSIHAPRCRGAMRHQHRQHADPEAVSIHAPRCRGAMPVIVGALVAGRCGFNPRSPLPGSDALSSSVTILANKMFQSTLPVAGERCNPARFPRRLHARFNPRSPLPGSDAGNRRRRRNATNRVSIHAPRCRGAMRKFAPVWTVSKRFQSTLPVAGERCRMPRPIQWTIS